MLLQSRWVVNGSSVRAKRRQRRPAPAHASVTSRGAFSRRPERPERPERRRSGRLGRYPAEFESSFVTEVGRSLVLPDGVDELVCDELAWGELIGNRGRSGVSAVVVGNRLLILPVPERLFADPHLHLDPHQTVWDALSIRGWGAGRSGKNGFTAVTANRWATGFAQQTSTVDRAMDRQGGVSSAQNAAREDAAVVVLARPIRSGAVAGAPAIEVVGARHRTRRFSGSGPSGRAVVHFDVKVAAGELVVVRQAWTADALSVTNVLSGLEPVETGVVLHHGSPCEAGDPEHELFVAVQPGIYTGRSGLLGEISAVDHAAYPMLVYGADPTAARTRASEVIASVHGSALDGQPVRALTSTERHSVLLARALAGPWPIQVLFDPFRSLGPSGQTAVRSLIAGRRKQGRTTVVMTDDPGLIRAADQCLGVIDGVVRSVRRTGLNRRAKR